MSSARTACRRRSATASSSGSTTRASRRAPAACCASRACWSGARAFDGDAWLAGHGIARRPGERVVSLFCYDNPAVPALLADLAREPTLLLLTPGTRSARSPTRRPACGWRACPG